MVRYYILSFWLLLSLNRLVAQDQDFSLTIESEYRGFFEQGLVANQKNHFITFALEPKYSIDWKEGSNALVFSGFLRLSPYQDGRTHADVRELYWQYVANNWEISFGLKKVFWGVTESIHLVDIINQTDILESFDGEEKLGQPMVHFSRLTNLGTLDLFVMPYHRTRAFPENEGRIRPPFNLIDKDPFYESRYEEVHPDVAIRWSSSFGIFDVGISNFYGNAREPLFQFQDDQTVRSFYPLINQAGLDLQATWNAFLWKYEGIRRTADIQDFTAFAIGTEYTISNILRSGLDIGLVSEYLYDSRGNKAISSLDNDLFLGARFAFNDVQSTQFLMGGIIDLDRNSTVLSFEGSRRVGSSWKMELETRIFHKADPAEFIHFLRKDSFLEFSLFRYF